MTLPESEPVVVAPSPEFYRWAFASMWTPGPFETQAEPRLLLPDRRRSQLAAPIARRNTCATSTSRRSGTSRSTRCIRATSCTTSTCVRWSRRSASRRFFAPASFVEGWAHYCEQMMIEAGFRRGDATLRLGQLAEALVRLARFVVGIRLHCEDLSVEQGMRFFRDEAFLEEATARREAERGTFDPTLPGLLARQADDAEAAARLQGTAGRQVTRCARSTMPCSRREARRSGRIADSCSATTVPTPSLE